MREMHVMIADGLSAEIDALHQRHGLRRLVQALLSSIIRRSLRREVNTVLDLDNHMRRDIGLRELDAEVDRVLEARFDQWKYYL